MSPATQHLQTLAPSHRTGRRVTIQLPCLMRKHLPTGTLTECKWTGAQHWMLGDPQGHPPRAVQRICDELVAKWNRQQPDTWLYWLD
jgi:hypothetical protein